MARTLDDLGDAFAKMHSENCPCFFVPSDPRATLNRRIVEFANEWRLPAICQGSFIVDMGGLLSYSPDRGCQHIYVLEDGDAERLELSSYDFRSLFICVAAVG